MIKNRKNYVIKDNNADGIRTPKGYGKDFFEKIKYENCESVLADLVREEVLLILNAENGVTNYNKLNIQNCFSAMQYNLLVAVFSATLCGFTKEYKNLKTVCWLLTKEKEKDSDLKYFFKLLEENLHSGLFLKNYALWHYNLYKSLVKSIDEDCGWEKSVSAVLLSCLNIYYGYSAVKDVRFWNDEICTTEDYIRLLTEDLKKHEVTFTNTIGGEFNEKTNTTMFDSFDNTDVSDSFKEGLEKLLDLVP